MVDKNKLTNRQRKRVEQIQALSEQMSAQDAEQARTEALQTARAIALAGLPKRKTSNRELIRTLRLGQDLWLRVIYQTDPDCILPYSEDRFVLAGIQTLALDQSSPVVFFDQVSKLLKMFGLSTDGRTLQLLRGRFKRLAGLSIRLRFAETQKGLHAASAGESCFIIERYLLPTRKELLAIPLHQRQLTLPGIVPDEGRTKYGVVLSDYFWKHLQDGKNQLLLPLELMRLFVNHPTGWDYAAFLVHRCSRAKSHSVVPHDVLMSLFKDSQRENDKKAIERLLKYHDQIMHATKGRLDAVLGQVGCFPSSSKGGRPKERWQLRVGPSNQIIWTGKQQDLF